MQKNNQNQLCKSNAEKFLWNTADLHFMQLDNIAIIGAIVDIFKAE